MSAKSGTPLTHPAPTEPASTQGSRRTAFMLGMYTVPDDFDRMFEDEIRAALEGEEIS